MDNYQFDYTNQTWVKNGVYQRCGHLKCMVIGRLAGSFPDPRWDSQACYGTRHAGEQPNLTAEVR